MGQSDVLLDGSSSDEPSLLGDEGLFEVFREIADFSAFGGFGELVED